MITLFSGEQFIKFLQYVLGIFWRTRYDKKLTPFNNKSHCNSMFKIDPCPVHKSVIIAHKND